MKTERDNLGFEDLAVTLQSAERRRAADLKQFFRES
jgi:hypothetical protein